MCGISGFFELLDRDNAATILEGMVASLVHRGPDGQGMWLATNRSIGLGHCRLAIIDLHTGQQPMCSADGRYIVVFNGEIYNFQEIRNELEGKGHVFRTKSDTEVVLESYKEWGVACVERLQGMFGLAVYDSTSHELFLARDRLGVKPLYYHAGNTGFYFGSEPKAILSTRAVPKRINYQALWDFLTLSYTLPPKTFFQDIQEMEPGTWMQVSKKGIVQRRYWSWQRTPNVLCEADAQDQSERALLESLEQHLISDVSVGAFLSGGIDSSLLVALLVRVLGRNDIPTFTVAFGEKAYDESVYARRVAEHLGTNHHEIHVGKGDANITQVEEVLKWFDQPFGDSSAIPTYMICREIRKFVKVAISGDGGDEMFGGYDRFWYADIAELMGRFPQRVARVLTSASKIVGNLAPEWWRQMNRLCLAAQNRDPARLLILSAYMMPEELNSIITPSILTEIKGYSPELSTDNPLTDPGGQEFIDATIWHALPGDYLRKIDIASSAHGLEVRVPFLGHQVVDCARKIPSKLKYSRSQNKILLRKLARRLLPAEIAERPKTGFGIPLDTWLGEKGRRAIHEQLTSPSARIRELIRSPYIESLLSDFILQKRDKARLSRYNLYQRVYCLWSLECWLKQWTPSL